jgi:hypothetical protein
MKDEGWMQNDEFLVFFASVLKTACEEDGE